MSQNASIPTPAPADRPSFKILVDGTQISVRYSVRCVAVSRGFNRIATAELILYDGYPAAETFQVSEAPDFVPGKEIEILAGYHGVDKRLFKGLIVRHGLRASSSKPSVLHIECKDRAASLAVARRSAYFYDMKDSEVIEEIASAAGLEIDVEPTSVSHPQMVQFYCTDWDFVVSRAEANAKLVHTHDGKLLVKTPDPGRSPVLNLRYGSNVLDFEAVMDARYQYSEVQALAWDAAGQEMLEAEGAKPPPVAPGNVGRSDLADALDLGAVKLKHGGHLSEGELKAWADGLQLRSALSRIQGRVHIQGFPGVLPGDVVELGGMGGRFSGKAVVSGVRHEIDEKNWETQVLFGLSPEWFGATPGIQEAPAAGLLPGITGLQIGLVTALEGDPAGEDRIQVRMPAIAPDEEGIWARAAALDAGQNRGTFFRPEIGDEVVLGFLNADPRNPVMLGMLNSSARPAPLKAKDANPQKAVVTRSEITLLFDDEKKVFSISTPGGNTLVLSDEEGSLTLQDQNGNKLVMNSEGISIESASDISVKASGDVKIEGVNVTSSAQAQLKAQGSGGAEFSSSGNTVVKGSMVQIN